MTSDKHQHGNDMQELAGDEMLQVQGGEYYLRIVCIEGEATSMGSSGLSAGKVSYSDLSVML